MANLYDQLKIDPDARPEDIRRAYRRLSKQCHPDVNGGAKWAEERFRRLHEAYRCLIDPERRRAYDRRIQQKFHSTSSVYSSSTAGAGQWTSSRPPAGYRHPKTNPFTLYFFLFGISLAFLLGGLLRSSIHERGGSKAGITNISKIDPLPSPEALEFLEFYKEYPLLISASEAQAVFTAPLPEGYTDMLKCFLMEGDLVAFRKHLHRPDDPLVY